jgi:hypothetical protein
MIYMHSLNYTTEKPVVLRVESVISAGVDDQSQEERARLSLMEISHMGKENLDGPHILHMCMV